MVVAALNSLSHIDFMKLEYFAVVAKHENVSQAAVEINTSQPSLSKIIRQLETALGVSLFDRQGKKIKLNEHGRIFLEFANETLKKYTDVCASFAELSSASSYMVRIGTTMPMDDFNLVGKFTGEFIQTRPNMALTFKRIPVDALRLALYSNTVDILITDIPIFDQNIIFSKLYTEHFGVLMSNENELVDSHDLHVEDLKGEVFFAAEPNESQRSTLDICQKAGFIPFIRYSGVSISIIDEFLRQNEGIALITDIIYKQRSKADWGNLRFIPLSNQYCLRDVGLSVLKNRAFTKASEDYYNFLLSCDYYSDS